MEWLHAIVDYGLIGLLICMSIIAVALAVERHLVYKKIHRPVMIVSEEG